MDADDEDARSTKVHIYARTPYLTSIHSQYINSKSGVKNVIVYVTGVMFVERSCLEEAITERLSWMIEVLSYIVCFMV